MCQAVCIRYLVAAQPGFTAGVFHIFRRVNTRCVAVPDIYLDIRHGGAAVLAVVGINTQGERNAALDVASVEIRADVGAIESGCTVVHEIRALFALGSHRA